MLIDIFRGLIIILKFLLMDMWAWLWHKLIAKQNEKLKAKFNERMKKNSKKRKSHY